MALIGNQLSSAENNSYRVLDNLASFTLTFDGSSSANVLASTDTIALSQHPFVTGQRVTYSSNGGSPIGGLLSGNAYYITKTDQNSFKLASSYVNAITNINIDLVGTEQVSLIVLMLPLMVSIQSSRQHTATEPNAPSAEQHNLILQLMVSFNNLMIVIHHQMDLRLRQMQPLYSQPHHYQVILSGVRHFLVQSLPLRTVIIVLITLPEMEAPQTLHFPKHQQTVKMFW